MARIRHVKAEPGEVQVEGGAVPTARATCPYCGGNAHLETHTLRLRYGCEHFDGYRGTVKAIRRMYFSEGEA